MDLDDSFTDRLIKRSKARKDYLKVKMRDSPGIKKTTLVEELQIPYKDYKELKKSPKHLCVEQRTSEHSKKDDLVEEVKENISVKRQEIKKNNYEKKDRPKEETPSIIRGLAALRKKHSTEDDKNYRKVSQDPQQVYTTSTHVVSTYGRKLDSTRNRLARLAADINDWEDNVKQSPLSSTSSTKESPAAIAKDEKDTLDSSFEPSKLPLQARRALFEQAAAENKVQCEKQVFKRRGSIAKRAAKFENAPKGKFRLAYQKPSTNLGSPAKSATAASPAKPCAVVKGNPIRSSAALTKSSDKPPIASTGCPTESGATGGSRIAPMKSFIPNTPVAPTLSPHQQQWAQTTSMEPEKKLPLSRLVDHFEKLTLSSKVTRNQSGEVSK